jgi:thiamine pyrophosphokinase
LGDFNQFYVAAVGLDGGADALDDERDLVPEWVLGDGVFRSGHG